jgi:hypothetical protein
MPETAATTEPDTEPQDNGPIAVGSRPDSYRFLVRKPLYPDAAPVRTCWSFDGLDAFHLEYYLPAILRSAKMTPGDFVMGALKFPRYREPAELFFTTAGFRAEDAALLCYEMPPMPEEGSDD